MKKILSFIKRRWWLVGLIILLALIGFSFIKKESQQKEIETTKVKRGDLERTVTLSGSIDAHQKADLRFQGSGLLSWVGVKEGDLVRKWQALASLDTRSLKKSFEKEMYDYLAYRADWEQGRQDYQYEDKWFEISDTAKRILEKNQYSLDKAVLDVELADLAVKFATLTSPFDGLVTKVDIANPGVNVTPATAEFFIVNPATVFFYAEADEDEVVEIKEDQTVTVYIDAYPQKTFSGKVTRVGFVPTTSTGSPKYLVEIDFDELDNSGYQFRLGMEGEGDISTAFRKDVLYIPIDSVSGTEEKWVYVINSRGEKEKRVVETGFQTDDDIEVVSGLNQGETVVSY
jgi:RND family efflux transporter MFP subunit